MTYDYRDALTGEELYREQMEERFIEFIDEMYPEVEIGGYNFSPAETLSTLDPTAFEQWFIDWIDLEIEYGNLIDLEYEDNEDEEDY